MEKIIGTYFLGSPVLDQSVVERVQAVLNKIHSSLGMDCPVIDECSISLTTPFNSVTKEAEGLEFGCAISSTLITHPFLNRTLQIREMKIETVNGESTLFFPLRTVAIYSNLSSQNNLQEYIWSLRKKIMSLEGFSWATYMPILKHPFIKILYGGDLSKNKVVLDIIKQSRSNNAIRFSVGSQYLYCLYETQVWEALCGPSTLELNA